TGQLAFLEARHRAHARVEDSIRHAKDTGLGRFPSREYGINTTWLLAVAIADDLTAWLRLLALPETLKTCEPKALRYRFLHIPARLTRSGRRRHLRLPQSWPWTQAAVAVFTAGQAIPATDLTGRETLPTRDPTTPKTRTAAPRGIPTGSPTTSSTSAHLMASTHNPVKDGG
ncbi:transposase, partial [Nostocoides vanveenii]|uniref:transposase n=1 Tax=Nostocoides vanveenii TaxID=330835 RepID=UPI0031E2DA30